MNERVDRSDSLQRRGYGATVSANSACVMLMYVRSYRFPSLFNERSRSTPSMRKPTFSYARIAAAFAAAGSMVRR